MIVIPTKKFNKRLENLERDALTVARAEKAIAKLRKASSLHDVPNVETIEGSPGYYRLRFGDYRIGFRLVDENTVILLSIGHRSVFYRSFP